ncbi:MAG: JAB domain-containing protein [Lachnospiraceae bacterium]|nr:JAB domain-containing protein [Lachnospiraceae bacterium]
MRINFYDARITDDDRTILVKEKGVNYCEDTNLNCPQKIANMMQDLLHMGTLAEEHCYMIALNTSCKMLGMFFLSKGTVDTSLLSPREIFMRALLIGAAQITICHNHPSGSPLPSETDIKLTQKFKEAGELLYIPLADHIIIGRNSYVSFREEKLL